MQAIQYINDKLNDSKNYAICLGVGVASYILTSCVGISGFGHIRPASQPGLIDSLIKDSDKYHISYSGDKDQAGAVSFDDKQDNITLKRGKKWFPIEDKKQLESIIKTMVNVYPIEDQGEKATLNFVKDNDGNVIGYIFSPVTDSKVRPAGENSYSIDSVSTIDAENRSSGSGNDSSASHGEQGSGPGSS